MDQLADYGLRIDAVVLNRIDPEVPEAPPRERLASALGPELAPQLASQIDRIYTAYAGAHALGERTRRSIDAITTARPGLQVWIASRQTDPPDTLPELRRFGAEIFG